MKRFISLILLSTTVVILIGCAGMTAQQRSDKDYLTNVGQSPFVGERGPSGQRLIDTIGP
jgi:hypothetical protein